MNIRERNKEKEKQEIEAYESNLKLHYESVKNELDTLIRSSIPSQMGTIKTIMWLNIVLTGLAVQIMVRSGNVNLWLLIPFLISSCASIGIALKAMIMGKKVHYGNYLKRTYMMSIPDGKWAKVDGIYRMFYDISRAVRYNGIVLIKRKKSIHYAMISTALSLVLFVILVVIHSIQGHNNGKETPTSTTAKSIRGENSKCPKTWADSNATTETTSKREVNASMKAEENASKGSEHRLTHPATTPSLQR